ENIDSIRNIARDILQSISLDENLARGYSAGRMPQETISISEQPGRQTSLQRFLSEYFSLADDAAKIISKSVMQSIGISEAAGRYYAAQRAGQEQITIADRPERQINMQRFLSEYFSINENLTFSTIRMYAKSILDTIGIDESIDKLYAAQRAGQEAISISESIDTPLSIARTLLDTIGISEAAGKYYAAQRTAQESIAVSEAPARRLNLQRFLSEYFSINESLTFSTIRMYVISVLDTIGIDESIDRLYAAQRTEEQILGIAGDMSKGIGKFLSDYLTLTESPSRIRGVIRTVFEQLQVTEGVSRSVSILRTIFDVVGVNEQGGPPTTTTTTIVVTTTIPSGGAGGGTTTTIPAEIIEIQLNTLNITLEPEEHQITSIAITNKGSGIAAAKISIEGRIWEFTQQEKTEVMIYPNSTNYANIRFFIPKTAEPGIYTGSIVIATAKTTHRIFTILTILPEKEKLLDLEIEAVKDNVNLGQPLSVKITAYSLGETKRFDFEIELKVKNPKTNETITSVKKAYAIETSLTTIIDILLPSDILPGKYIVDAVAYYVNKTAAASATFVIIGPPITLEQIIKEVIEDYLIYILLVIAAIIAIIIVKVYKKKKERKKRILKLLELYKKRGEKRRSKRKKHTSSHKNSKIIDNNSHKKILERIKEEREKKLEIPSSPRKIKLSEISEQLEKGKQEKQNSFFKQEPQKMRNPHIKSARLTYLKNYFNKKGEKK
ncbi:MAG: hypothetical protein NT129_05465, partial [Candidatus Aenigmarchaeota archaeon]|nr:hypothetical protein [Candidatus Aenigmarchaeota archaeon]